MKQLRINQLNLRVRGLDKGQAQALAQGVGQKLLHYLARNGHPLDNGVIESLGPINVTVAPGTGVAGIGDMSARQIGQAVNQAKRQVHGPEHNKGGA